MTVAQATSKLSNGEGPPPNSDDENKAVTAPSRKINGPGHVLGNSAPTPEQGNTSINLRGKSAVLSFKRPINSSKRSICWNGHDFVGRYLNYEITEFPGNNQPNSEYRLYLQQFSDWFHISTEDITSIRTVAPILSNCPKKGVLSLLPFATQDIANKQLFGKPHFDITPLDISGILSDTQFDKVDRHWCIDRILSSELSREQRHRLLVFLATFFIKSFCSSEGDTRKYDQETEVKYLGAALIFVRHHCRNIPLLVSLAFFSYLTHRKLERDLEPQVQPITCNIADEDTHFEITGISDCEDWPLHFLKNHPFDVTTNEFCKSAIKIHSSSMPNTDIGADVRREKYDNQTKPAARGKSKKKKPSQNAGSVLGRGAQESQSSDTHTVAKAASKKKKKVTDKKKKSTKINSKSSKSKGPSQQPAAAVTNSAAASSAGQLKSPHDDWKLAFTVDDMQQVNVFMPYYTYKWVTYALPPPYSPKRSAILQSITSTEGQSSFNLMDEKNQSAFSYHFMSEVNCDWWKDMCDLVSRDSAVPQGEALQRSTINKNKKLKSIQDKKLKCTQDKKSKSTQAGVDSDTDEDPEEEEEDSKPRAKVYDQVETALSPAKASLDGDEVENDADDTDESEEVELVDDSSVEDDQLDKQEELEEVEVVEVDSNIHFNPFPPFAGNRGAFHKEKDKYGAPYSTHQTRVNSPHLFKKALYGVPFVHDKKYSRDHVNTQHKYRKNMDREGYKAAPSFNYDTAPDLVNTVPTAREKCTKSITIMSTSSLFPSLKAVTRRDLWVLQEGEPTTTMTKVQTEGKVAGKKKAYRLPPLRSVYLTNLHDSFWNQKCSQHPRGCGANLAVGNIVKVEGEDLVVVQPGIATFGAYVYVAGVRCCKVGIVRCLPRHIGVLANSYGEVTKVSRKPTDEDKNAKGSELFVVQTNGWAELMLMSKGSLIASGVSPESGELLPSQAHLDSQRKGGADYRSGGWTEDTKTNPKRKRRSGGGDKKSTNKKPKLEVLSSEGEDGEN